MKNCKIINIISLSFVFILFVTLFSFDSSAADTGHDSLRIPYNISSIDYISEDVVNRCVEQVYSALNGTVDYPNTYVLTAYEKNSSNNDYTLLFQCNYGINNYITDIDSYYLDESQYINIYGTFSVLCFYNSSSDTITLQGGHWNVSPNYKTLTSSTHSGYILSSSDDSIILNNGILYADHHTIVIPEPEPELGHIIQPDFENSSFDNNTPDVSDTWLKKIYNNITRLINNINNGFLNIVDNLESFFKPYFDFFVVVPSDQEIFELFHSSEIYPLYSSATTVINTYQNIFNVEQGHDAPLFELDFSNVVGFESVGKQYLDFSFFIPYRQQFNVILKAILIFGFGIYFVKAIPDLIGGRGAKND